LIGITIGIIYFICFAIYHLTKKRDPKKVVKESEPLKIDIVYKSPIDRGEYVDFEEVK